MKWSLIIIVIFTLFSCREKNNCVQIGEEPFLKNATYFKEMVVGIKNGKVDTLSWVQVNLRTWENTIFVEKRNPISIGIVKNQQTNDIYSFNLVYKIKLDNEHKSTSGLTIDADCQVVHKNDTAYVMVKDFINKDRISLLGKLFTGLDYNEINYYSILQDADKIKFARASF